MPDNETLDESTPLDLTAADLTREEHQVAERAVRIYRQLADDQRDKPPPGCSCSSIAEPGNGN